MPKPFDHGASDDWEPEDDPDFYGPDGEPSYQGNPASLRWRIITPENYSIDVDGNNSPFTTRRDAVVFAGSPHMGMTQYHFERLLRETDTVAGWSKISLGGWTIEPIKPNARHS